MGLKILFIPIYKVIISLLYFLQLTKFFPTSRISGIPIRVVLVIRVFIDNVLVLFVTELFLVTLIYITQ